MTNLSLFALCPISYILEKRPSKGRSLKTVRITIIYFWHTELNAVQEDEKKDTCLPRVRGKLDFSSVTFGPVYICGLLFLACTHPLQTYPSTAFFLAN